MSDKDNEEFFHPSEPSTATDKAARKKNAAPHGASRRPTQRSAYSLKRQAARKRRRQQRIFAGVSAFVLIFIIIVAAVVIISRSERKGDPAVLQGAWYYDSYTEYEFDGSGSGCMCIDKTDHYKFTYTVDGDTVKLNFALDYVTDCEYDFKVENDTLTLIGGNGTATPGQKYILKRIR